MKGSMKKRRRIQAGSLTCVRSSGANQIEGLRPWRVDVGADLILVVPDPDQVVLFDVRSSIDHILLEKAVGAEQGVEFAVAREQAVGVVLAEREPGPHAVPVGLQQLEVRVPPLVSLVAVREEEDVV